MGAVRVIARITWLHLRRGRTKWVSALLVLLPVLFATMLSLGHADVDRSWDMAVNTALRLTAMLAVAVHLAPSVGEELERRTFTYLWSRPMPRRALLLGKLAAVAPVAAAACALSMVAVWMITWQGDALDHLGDLARAVLAVVGVVAAGSSLALVAGAYFPRHPLAVILAYVIIGDRLLGFVPALREVSIYSHAIGVAGGHDSLLPTESFLAGAIGLAVLSTVWLGLALWRVESAEYALPDG